jgi:hypothetical protein
MPVTRHGLSSRISRPPHLDSVATPDAGGCATGGQSTQNKGVAMTEFLANNWLWIVFLLAMLVMHRRGGCGTHGHHQQQQPEKHTEHAHAGQGKSAS